MTEEKVHSPPDTRNNTWHTGLERRRGGVEERGAGERKRGRGLGPRSEGRGPGAMGRGGGRERLPPSSSQEGSRPQVQAGARGERKGKRRFDPRPPPAHHGVVFHELQLVGQCARVFPAHVEKAGTGGAQQLNLRGNASGGKGGGGLLIFRLRKAAPCRQLQTASHEPQSPPQHPPALPRGPPRPTNPQRSPRTPIQAACERAPRW